MIKVFKAIARSIPYSPYKLRPIADVIRGKNAQYALNWLSIYRNRRTEPIAKALKSALANAGCHNDVTKAAQMSIAEIKIDQGMTRKYFKPGAQGRAVILRRRHCHITVVVEPNKKGIQNGTKG